MIDLCYNVEVLKLIRFVKIALEVITVAVPIILIVVCMVDFIKCLKDGDVMGGINLIKNRLIAAIIIFLVPTIVTTVIKLIGNFGNDYYACIENATTEGIQVIYNDKAKELVDKAVETNSYNDYLRAKSYLSNIGDEDLINEYNEILASVYSKIKENINNNLNVGTPLNIDSGIFLRRFNGDYNTIQYYEVIPEGATTNMPLVIYLHGDGSTLSSISNSTIITKTQKIYGGYAPYILIVPYSEYSDWIDYNMPQTVKELAEHVAGQYGSNMKKIIITGHSRGGMGVWGAVNVYPDFYYKAVPISCAIPIDVNNFSHTKIKAFIGTEGDETIYYGQMSSNVDSINSNGGKAELNVLNGYDHADVPNGVYTASTFEWMISD